MSKAGFKLECSHYKPEETAVAGENSLPIVIYCHCNSGSRRDAEEALHVLMPHGIHVVTLDFAVGDFLNLPINYCAQMSV